MSKFRTEKDTMGEVQVPVEAYFGPQTQRAVLNFPISGIRFGRRFIEALGLVKEVAARVNGELGLLPASMSAAIQAAAREVREGKLDSDFPLDIFQTGSGTSMNMNANEVIARRAMELAAVTRPEKIHPNDHVNFGQSSNDVFPTATRIAAYLSCRDELVPALFTLLRAFREKAKEYGQVAKTGRTHLMDAMPVTFGQVFNGYCRQIDLDTRRLHGAFERLAELPVGGTAVGTGINTHPEFAPRFLKILVQETGHPFCEAEDHFEAQGSADVFVELSGILKTTAISLLKIANDIRWMNSGPVAGLGEISLPALQPGSSIMPGKVNPVMEEALSMVCVQVVGYDAALLLCGMSSQFELNTMQPLIAHNLLEQIRLLSNVCRAYARNSVSRLTVNIQHVKEKLGKNPILVTALNPVVGYEKAAQIAKKALSEGISVKEAARELTDLSSEELDKMLDPLWMTRGGLLHE